MRFPDERRASAIDAEWVERPSERAARDAIRADPGAAIAALAADLPGADAARARHRLWLALPALPDEALPDVAAITRAIRDPDARLLAPFLLLGRARGAPHWWRDAAGAALAATEGRTSRALDPERANVRAALAEPERFTLDGGFRAGARLFNAGEFHAAHDAWEDVWRPNRDPERDFFRGLINLAVAFDKARLGNPRGVARLARRARHLLSPFEPVHRAVDVAGLRRALETIEQQARAWESGTRSGLDPALTPVLPA